MGYVLYGGYDIPPPMLTSDELEASLRGAAWVARRGDPFLARGARDLITKLSPAVPDSLRPILLDDSLRPITLKSIARESFDAGPLRQAVRESLKVVISYMDGDDQISRRTVWPIFMAYMEDIRIVVAWGELRGDFRHFRTYRIASFEVLTERHPARPAELRARWKALQKHPTAPSREGQVGDK